MTNGRTQKFYLTSVNPRQTKISQAISTALLGQLQLHDPKKKIGSHCKMPSMLPAWPLDIVTTRI